MHKRFSKPTPFREVGHEHECRWSDWLLTTSIIGVQSGKALKSLLSGSFGITFLAARPTFAKVANFRFPHGVRWEFAYTIRVPQEILPVDLLLSVLSLALLSILSLAFLIGNILTLLFWN